MAGKQLGEILKSIERQLFKLVLSHAQKFGDREREAVGKKNCIRNNSKKPHALGRQTFEREACDRKKALKSHQGNYKT